MRIREAQKHVDPVDPDSDPEHWQEPDLNLKNQPDLE
jgi:hypothetical protein